MIYEKVKVDFSGNSPTTAKLLLAGQEIEVKTYLSDTEQSALIRLYLEEYFREDAYDVFNVFRAEKTLMVSVLDVATNLMISEIANDGTETPTLTMDNIYSNIEFWNEVQAVIENYWEFKTILDMTVEEEKEKRRIQNSLGRRMELIYAKLSNFLESIADNEMSDEKLNSLRSLVKEIESSPILQAIATTRQTLS